MLQSNVFQSLRGLFGFVLQDGFKKVVNRRRAFDLGCDILEQLFLSFGQAEGTPFAVIFLIKEAGQIWEQRRKPREKETRWIAAFSSSSSNARHLQRTSNLEVIGQFSREV